MGGDVSLARRYMAEGRHVGSEGMGYRGKPLGKIAQVEKTYSVVGNMNEHQVAITESTFGGRHELVDTTGIMDYGKLDLHRFATFQVGP